MKKDVVIMKIFILTAIILFSGLAFPKGQNDKLKQNLPYENIASIFNDQLKKLHEEIDYYNKLTTIEQKKYDYKRIEKAMGPSSVNVIEVMTQLEEGRSDICQIYEFHPDVLYNKYNNKKRKIRKCENLSKHEMLNSTINYILKPAYPKTITSDQLKRMFIRVKPWNPKPSYEITVSFGIRKSRTNETVFLTIRYKLKEFDYLKHGMDFGWDIAVREDRFEHGLLQKIN